jgi:CubicO group peptidase (beta-lactamase class C family)
LNRWRFLRVVFALLACGAGSVFVAARTQPVAQRDPAPGNRFDALDLDGDGKISRQEFPQERLFGLFDRDGDGFVTRAEATQAILDLAERGRVGPSPEITTATRAGAPVPGTSITLGNCRRAADYSARFKGISMLVMLDGKVIFEDYPNGGSPARAHELASGTKSFCGAMAVAACADGILKLDEKVADTIPEWRSDPLKSRMTIRQLLTLTGGQETGSRPGWVPDYADAVAIPCAAKPGAKFAYGSVPFQVFGEVMRRKLALQGKDPVAYMKGRVFDPIGLEIGSWRRGADGNPHMPSGAALTARDWAKFGELIRLGGAWTGKEVLPRALLEECFMGTPANPAYGITWWLNRNVDIRKRVTIPQLLFATDLNPATVPVADLVLAAGAGKQRLYISREKKLVVVRQATGIIQALMNADQTGFSDAEFLAILFAGNQPAPDKPGTEASHSR